MAIKQLTEEQVQTWTLEEKDQWWFENVWRGDMPQLTIRSALSGILIGGALSLTNLYVGAKTGWTLGVGVTSVILAFAVFKILSQLGLGFVIQFPTCLAMFAGALCFWLAERRWRDPASKPHQITVKNQEPICAGLIAGGALMGIVVALVELLVLGEGGS